MGTAADVLTERSQEISGPLEYPYECMTGLPQTELTESGLDGLVTGSVVGDTSVAEPAAHYRNLA